MDHDIQGPSLRLVRTFLATGSVMFFAEVIDDVNHHFVEFAIILIIEQHQVFILLLFLAEFLELLFLIFHCLAFNVFQ